MSQTKKPSMIVEVYEQFPRRRGQAATHQFTLEQVKKYLSPRPLRRAPPRKAASAEATVDAEQDNAADRQPPGQADA